jgi:2,4-dienoyl-CoA reductase (NADPH2)
MVEKEKPDLLVVASGATPAKLDIRGIDRPNVVNAWDVLNGNVPDIGKQVVIIGGGATGCETALFIANLDVLSAEAFAFLAYHSADDIGQLRDMLYRSGRTITVLEILDRMAENVGISTRWSLIKNLKLMGVNLRPRTKILSIEDNAVIIVETDNGKESIPADTIVIAAGTIPVNDLSREVTQDGIEVITIGDAREPRKIADAIREGFNTALKI